MVRRIDKTAISPEEKLSELAKAQGVQPIDFDDLIASAPGGPDDETADDMIAAIYEWRRQGRDRSLR
jgi:hypothetical protein